MSDPELVRPLLAAALSAPFAFRLAAVVWDGREYLVGGLFLVLSGSIAALVCFLSGSLLLAVPSALAVVLLLAHARFLAAHRASEAAGNPEASGEAIVAAAPAPGQVPEPPPPDALQAGMAFIGDMLETADRVRELRHQRRLRQLERQQAERQAAAPAPKPTPRRLAPRVRRDGPLWETKRLSPPE